MPSRPLIRAFEQALNMRVSSMCPDCGWPAVQSERIAVLKPGEVQPTCAACDGPVDAKGRAMGSLTGGGDRYLKTIILGDDLTEKPGR